jgi:hypothetical protein
MRTASKEVLNGLKNKEEKQSIALAEFKSLSDNYNPKFWEPMKAKLLARADAYAKAREEKFFELSEVELKVYKAREEELRYIVQVPSDIVESYKSLVKQNKELKEEIRSYERRLRSSI